MYFNFHLSFHLLNSSFIGGWSKLLGRKPSKAVPFGRAVDTGTTVAMMSSKNETDNTAMLCCASCGTAAVDDVKLKKCACGLVNYCSIACQKDHRSKHKKSYKKRLAELRDEILFKRPDGSHMGECPICCLPLSNDSSKSSVMPCCSKFLCRGCNYANQVREIQGDLKQRCAFCREPMAKSQAEAYKYVMKRIKKNDPAAMHCMGKKHYDEGNYDKAFAYFTTAAELGNAGAHYNLSCLYRLGQGVEMDMKKEVYYLEKAAIGGHPEARHKLGVYEAKNRRLERARKHFIIAAGLGHDESLKKLMQLYANGYASKEDYADALRAFQAAIETTKSPERETVEEAIKRGEVKISGCC